MDAAVQQLLKSLSNSGTRSGERLAILASFIHTLPPEKMTKLKGFSVDWKELEGELVPTLSTEFFE